MLHQTLFKQWFSENYDILRNKLCFDNLGELYEANCEDCFHNAFLCVFQSLKRYEGETDFKTLFVAAYRRQRKTYRMQEVKEIQPSDLFWAFLMESENDPEEEEQRKILLEERTKALLSYVANHFTNEQKEVFKMYFLNGCTKEQIAAYCGKSVPTITKCISWCRDCLTCQFKDYCLISNYMN